MTHTQYGHVLIQIGVQLRIHRLGLHLMPDIGERYRIRVDHPGRSANIHLMEDVSKAFAGIRVDLPLNGRDHQLIPKVLVKAIHVHDPVDVWK